MDDTIGCSYKDHEGSDMAIAVNKSTDLCGQGVSAVE